MKSISEKVVKKIKEEKINPLPKWQFLLKDYVIWTAAVISGLIGSLAAATIIHVVLNRDWFVYLSTHRPPWQHLIFDLPYIWFAVLLITILIADYNVKHSKSGYRYSFYYIVALSLVFSLAIGALFNIGGLGERADSTLAKEISAYRSVEKRAIELWTEPEEGHLGGEVTKVSEKSLELQDPSGKTWEVDISKAHLLAMSQIKVGKRIKIIGRLIGENKFEAEDIYPWIGPRPRRIFIHQESMLPENSSMFK